MESCSNLKGLDLDDGGLGIEYEILQSIGHRLQYLVLHDHLEQIVDSTDENQIVFKNLLELQQGYACSDESIQEILKTSINLEKVKLSHDPQNLVEEILIKCERLRYLELGTDICLDDVLQSLERSLCSTNTMYRDKLKIRINTREPEVAECEECVMKLVRISNALSVNPVDQWMIILYLENSKMESAFVDDLRRALAADLSDIVVLPDRNDQLILITNAGCTICGWKESWLMSL